MQFKDIVGQEIMANKLTGIIDSGRVSHAQLFLGDTASGSLALAIAYAQYLNCQNRQHYDNGRLHADSCGECPSCKKFQQLTHSDLHLYFPSATTGKVTSKPSSADFQTEFRDFLNANNQKGDIDKWYDFLGTDKNGMIRELDADNIVRTLGMKAYEGNYKVIIVWMAEKMNTVAANKILKVLEEPSPNTLIILVAESSERMLSTILSRAQQVRIPTKTHPEWDINPEFASLYVTWMRQLFKLNMATLSEWVDTIAAKGREQQKQFLLYAQEATRDCFLRHMAGTPMTMDFGDEKFNASFPNMITERNAEGLNNAFDEALFAIDRNAYSKIALMELSFRVCKLLKKR